MKFDHCFRVWRKWPNISKDGKFQTFGKIKIFDGSATYQVTTESHKNSPKITPMRNLHLFRSLNEVKKDAVNDSRLYIFSFTARKYSYNLIHVMP